MKTPIKSLGSIEAKFILGLYEDNKNIFSLSDAKVRLKLPYEQLQQFIDRLLKKKVIERIISGLYMIIPYQMGYQTENYMLNPYVVAYEIIKHKLKLNEPSYYISHASALSLHQMTTQPCLSIYTTVTKQIKQKYDIKGYEFKFITCKPEKFFGVNRIWLQESNMVYISDHEKTIIDGLWQPGYCGGITEVAKGLWIKKEKVNLDKLLDYAERMDKGVIYRRLGLILEAYALGNTLIYDRLKRKINNCYHLLDPSLEKEGKFNARWRLQLNVTIDELKSIVRT